MWKPGSSKPRQGDKKEAKTPSRPPAQMIGGSALPERENAIAKKPATLSQKTLAMKFMQRKKQTEADRKAAMQERKKQDAWAEATPEAEPQNESSIICVRDAPDPSLPLVFGRRSFGGFNKGVEDEYRDATRQMRYAESEEKELREEVSAEEMVSRMAKYTGLGRGGNNGGNSNQRNRKRQRK